MAHVLINLDVDDLERAVAFYTQAFDLTVGRRFGVGAIEVLGAEAPIYLLHKAAGTCACAGGATRDYRRHWTPVHLDFIVDDVDVAAARAVAAGATLESPAATHAWGRMAILADPSGHGLCLLQFTGRGYDELLPQP